MRRAWWPHRLSAIQGSAVTTTFGNLGDMVISLQVRGHPGEGNQQLYRDGMPFGTRGGMSGQYVFPADGDYALTIGDLALGSRCAAHGVR